MKIVITLLSLIFLGTQVGCSASSDSVPLPSLPSVPGDNSGTGDKDSSAVSTFSGTWKSMCLANNESGSRSMQFDLTFDNGVMTQDIQKYRDSDCFIEKEKVTESGAYTLRSGVEANPNVIVYDMKINDTMSQKFYIKTVVVDESLVISRFQTSEDKLDKIVSNIQLMRLADWEDAMAQVAANLPEKTAKLEEGRYQMTSNSDCEFDLQLGRPSEDHQDVYFKLPPACGDDLWIFTCPKGLTMCAGDGNWNLFQTTSEKFYIEEAFTNKPYTFIKID